MYINIYVYTVCVHYIYIYIDTVNIYIYRYCIYIYRYCIYIYRYYIYMGIVKNMAFQFCWANPQHVFFSDRIRWLDPAWNYGLEIGRALGFNIGISSRYGADGHPFWWQALRAKMEENISCAQLYIYIRVYIILYNIILYYIILYHTILYYIILYYIILYYIVLYIILYIIYYIILYIILYYITLYYILYIILLYIILNIIYYIIYYIILYILWKSTFGSLWTRSTSRFQQAHHIDWNMDNQTPTAETN